MKWPASRSVSASEISWAGVSETDLVAAAGIAGADAGPQGIAGETFAGAASANEDGALVAQSRFAEIIRPYMWHRHLLRSIPCIRSVALAVYRAANQM